MLLQNNTIGPYLNSIVVALSSTVLALHDRLARGLRAGAHPFPGEAGRRADLPRAAGRRDRRGGGARRALAGRRRGRDRAVPAGAWDVRAALQGCGRQQRHRVLDDFEPDHAADRRRAADLCDVPASEAARHADRADFDLYRRQPADRRLADARLLRRRAARSRGERGDRRRLEVPGLLHHRAAARPLRVSRPPSCWC